MPKRTDINTVLIIGAGPIIIGQACEFDYSGTQACKALKEEGYRVVLVNSNPATIMTDPEFADRTYIEPITPECVEKIIVRELETIEQSGVGGKLVLLPTLGGQTALNIAMSLHRSGVLERLDIEMIGANAEAIERGEDRQLFKDAMIRIDLDVPSSGVAHTLEEALEIAGDIGKLPLIIRPAYTLGGTGGGIAYNRDEFEEMIKHGLDLSPVTEVLVEESLTWLEGIRDGGYARPCRQLRDHLLDRKLRSHGRAHRRFDYRCPDADTHRQGVPNHARRVVRGNP